MTTTMESTRFTDTEGEELADYRPVSRWAVASVLLGFLSPMALIHPLLLVVPGMGVVSALIAARQFASPASLKTGQAAMKWGLFLSTFFGLFAAASAIYQERYLERHARAHAERWLDLIREGKLHEAHQLTLFGPSRVPPGKPLDLHYATPDPGTEKEKELPPHADAGDMEDMQAMMEPEPHEQLQMWRDAAPLKRMIELGPRAQYKFVRTVEHYRTSAVSMVFDQLYEVTDATASGDQPLQFRLRLERNQDLRVADWRVIEVGEAKGS